MRTYEAERATLNELRRLSALRADFVSLVSHELRSPMAAVIGSALTLQQRWRELRPEQREAFLAVIADETTRLSMLVGDVLDTSRIEAGTFGYAFSDVDLVEIVRDSVAAAELGQDEVRLTSDLAPSLPYVRGDADRLRQLVDNLISNAVKFSNTGGEVRVLARHDDGRVIVRVDDDGPGIPLEEHEQIFEKFGRAVGSSKPGTGLGLFLARSFAEAHGGSLEVESTPGRGSDLHADDPARLSRKVLARELDPRQLQLAEELARALGDRRTQVFRLDTTASPRSARISPTSQSWAPIQRVTTAAPSVSGVAPRSIR